MLNLYKNIMRVSEPLIKAALHKRQKAGKESLERLHERLGEPNKTRPEGSLLWVHAASVGESQSTLILIKTLLERYPHLNVMVTTGTVTSAQMMEANLPERAFHQFYPVDHPDWVDSFLNHWKPDLILWAESELWPNMLQSIGTHDIPLILINARLSPASYKRWKLFKNSAKSILNNFSAILCQTEHDAELFKKLGSSHALHTGNLKYNAAPLAASEQDLKTVLGTINNRPCWVYASTHAGEEALAARVHAVLKASIPDILTIIVPRHPERREEIGKTLESSGVELAFRGENKKQPEDTTDVYIADTLGELGLFYRAAPIACIGRSFSDDGGGGHNPIEAAQLHCAVLHGPHVQNLQEIFDEMNEAGAAQLMNSEQSLTNILHELLTDHSRCNMLQEKAYSFSQSKGKALGNVLGILQPYLDQLDLQRVAS